MEGDLLFDQSLKKLNVLFKFSGMNLQREIKTVLDMIKYRWLFTFNFLWVLSATVASFYYIFLGIAQGKNFVEITSVAPCTTFTILSMIKSLFHLINEAEVSKLIESMRKLEIDEKYRDISPEKNKIVTDNRRFLNRVINVLYFLNCSMIVVFDLTPLVLIAVKYHKTHEFEMLLPYLDVFSFIPYEFKYWPFAYFHQIWSECIVLLEMGAADYLFFTYCTYIMTQFRLLQHDIERIIPDTTQVMSDEIYQAKLVELVKWHQAIIESSDMLERIYSKSNLFNFMSSSLVICLTGFNVTIVDDIVVVVTFLTFLFMGLMQVFFLCFFADLMVSASMDVSIAVYNCRWYLASVKVGRGLLLVQTRSQKASKITAADFADVNLNAFMRVLSTAWSYFALLQTIYGGSNKLAIDN